MMMIMTVCFANREYCILLFLKDSFSITLEPNVTIHWFFLCACDRVHVCRCEMSGWGACACVWVCVCVVHQTFCMCTRVRKTIFCDMTWMHIKQKGVRGWGWGGYSTQRAAITPLPQIEALAVVFRYEEAGGGRNQSTWETPDKHIPQEMTSRVDWLEGTCFQYATLCKRCVWEISCQREGEMLMRLLSSSWNLSDL